MEIPTEGGLGLAFSAVEILAALVLVGLNGFFVAAEFAIVKVRRTRLEELAGQGVKAARISILCVDQMDEYLSATQLGITLVSLALGWIGEPAFSSVIGRLIPGFLELSSGVAHALAAGIAFFIITLLHVVLGELVPKSMAIQDAEKIVLKVSKPLSMFYRMSHPLIWSFTRLANGVVRLLGYHEVEEQPLSENELKLVMKESREEGVITESEAQIITRAFEFSDKRASEIMVPAQQVDYVSLSWSFEQNMDVIRKRMRTRLPLCRTDFRDIVGILHLKDVWPMLLTNFSNEAFEKTARAPIYAEPGMRQDKLMKMFQGRRGHMAIVQDSSTRANLGIVTMEDVLEELVGDIRDEHGG